MSLWKRFSSVSLLDLNSRVIFSSVAANSRAVLLRRSSSSTDWLTVRCLLTFAPDSADEFVEFIEDRHGTINGRLQFSQMVALKLIGLGIPPGVFGLLP